MAEIFLNPGEAATAQQAVQTTQDSTVELAKNLAELTSELIQAILLLIKQSQEKKAENQEPTLDSPQTKKLEVDTEAEDLDPEQTEEKPRLIEIQAGKTKIFKGFEGQEPQRNSLSPDQIQLLQQLIQTPSTDRVEQPLDLSSAAETLGGRVITLKIDGDTVLRLDNGSLTNHLYQQPIPELDRSQEVSTTDQEQAIVQNDPETTEIFTSTDLESQNFSPLFQRVLKTVELQAAFGNQSAAQVLEELDQIQNGQVPTNSNALDDNHGANLNTEDGPELSEQISNQNDPQLEKHKDYSLADFFSQDDPQLEDHEGYENPDFTNQNELEDTEILDDLDPDYSLNHNDLEEHESHVEVIPTQLLASTTLGTLQELNAEFPDTFVGDELDTLLDPDQLLSQQSQGESNTPIDAEAPKLSLGDTLRADLRKTFNLSPETQQFVQGVGQAIKDRANQDIGKTRNFVTNLREDHKARQVANTALILLDATDPLGKGFEAEDYHIEALDRKTISIKGAEGQELLRFEDSPFGPKILNNNLTPTQIQEFSAARQQINKHGAELLLNTEPHARASYLGGLTPKGDRDVIKGVQNERAIAQATTILNHFNPTPDAQGKQSYTAGGLEFTQKGDNLQVSHPQRGVLLSRINGEIKGSLTPDATKVLRTLSQQIQDLEATAKTSISTPSQKHNEQIEIG